MPIASRCIYAMAVGCYEPSSTATTAAYWPSWPGLADTAGVAWLLLTGLAGEIVLQSARTAGGHLPDPPTRGTLSPFKSSP